MWCRNCTSGLDYKKTSKEVTKTGTAEENEPRKKERLEVTILHPIITTPTGKTNVTQTAAAHYQHLSDMRANKAKLW